MGFGWDMLGLPLLPTLLKFCESNVLKLVCTTLKVIIMFLLKCQTYFRPFTKSFLSSHAIQLWWKHLKLRNFLFIVGTEHSRSIMTYWVLGQLYNRIARKKYAYLYLFMYLFIFENEVLLKKSWSTLWLGCALRYLGKECGLLRELFGRGRG